MVNDLYNIYRYSECREAYKHVLLKRSFDAQERAEAQEHGERLDNSLSRTRRLFFDTAMCNRLPLFTTVTFNSDYDRFDLPSLKKSFCKWLNNYKYRVDADFKYMFVPEQHENGAWHFHGLTTFPIGLQTPLYIKKRVGEKLIDVKNTRHYLSWPSISEKFGFYSASIVQDYDKAVSYIQKYITKAFQDARFKSVQLLLKSKGMNKPELVYQAFGEGLKVRPDFENEFCAVSWQDVEETASVYRHWTYTGVDLHQMTPFEPHAFLGDQMAMYGFKPSGMK